MRNCDAIAIRTCMRKNHEKWRCVLSDSGFADGYISKFEQNLTDLVSHE
ncbi:BnaC04g37370D [Brassica napus]|nr:BnaC04g37370D [Brassica napus]